MASLHEIERWFTYAKWANDHMLAACETISEEAFRREVGVSFGSVQGTLEHMYGADWIWLERFHGRTPAAFPPKGVLTTVALCRAAFDAMHDDRMRVVRGLTQAQVDAPLHYANTKGVAFSYDYGDLLFHLSNHTTYHRGQVMQLVRQLGGTVTSSDFLFWLPTAPG